MELQPDAAAERQSRAEPHSQPAAVPRAALLLPALAESRWPPEAGLLPRRPESQTWERAVQPPVVVAEVLLVWLEL